MQAILTINAGSSSLKFALYTLERDEPLASGLVDRIGPGAVISMRRPGDASGSAETGADAHDHASALRSVLALLSTGFAGLQVVAVGHRIVHGGAELAQPILLDDRKLAELALLNDFAPLHQPHNLAGVKAAMEAYPAASQVACFDTAFHRTHSFVNDAYALPRAYYEKGVRRYGFHGISYAFIAGELGRIAPALAEGRVIVAHLGNGASVCALRNGRSVASTMGFSALDGLPMGTRCGQIDPGVILYLMDKEGLSAAEITDLLYRKSGLLGLSDVSSDMRALEASPEPAAAEAIDYFVAGVQREIGAMAAALAGVDALVFSGGIGENSRTIRARICEGLAWMGVELDPSLNAANNLAISRDTSRVSVMAVRTNEELVIARAVRSLVVNDKRSAA